MMVMLDISEWILNFFIFSLGFLFSCIGILLFTLILYAVLDWITNIIKRSNR